ncbi:MAG: papain-like cysteine protease family protein [Actinocatenispora sp.]
MNFSPGGRGRRIRLLAAGLLAVAAAAIPASAASASPSASAVQPVVHQASTVDPHLTSAQLGISMQVQQYDEWCWVASGATIAAYKGVSVDQNSFCDLARGYPTGTACPNQPGYLSWDQNAFSQLGINPGGETGALSWGSVVGEINANRPVLTGIAWTSGGGHAEVIYGYDDASQAIYFGDPWPSDNRYNLMSYSSYVSNSSFIWDDSLYGIGG